MNSVESLLLKIKDIFPNFQCNLQDLRNPTEEFVTNFYTNFLQEFEVDVSNLHQMQLQQSNVLAVYPDAHSLFVHKANLLRCIRAFDIIPDFGMMDINSPTPNRTQQILRGLSEFWTLSDGNFWSLQEKCKIIISKRQKTMISKMNEKEERKTYLNDLGTNVANIQKEVKQLEEHLHQLEQNAPNLKTKKQLAKRVIDLANDKLREKEKELQKVNKEIATLTNKMKECTGMIVDSPSSFLSDMDSQREKAQELEELAEQKEKMVAEKTQKDLKLQTYLSLLQDKIQVLNEVFKIFKLLKEESKEVSDIEKNLKSSQEKLNELMSSLLVLSNKKQVQQEALQDSHLQWKTLEPQLTQNVASCVRELNKKKEAKNKMINGLKEDAMLEENKSELIIQFKKSMEQFEIAVKAGKDMQNQCFEEIKNRVDADKENLHQVVRAKDKAKPRKTKKDKK